MRKLARSAALGVVAAILAGCTSAIHNQTDLKQPGINFVDARQRAVLTGGQVTTTTSNGNTTVEDKRYITCGEPSPDVFSVLASSFGLDVGLAPSSASDTVKISSALSENASTIARTQTINLLRESFFRTCERYMNGAISPAEMIVQSARDQRAMVSVLAIEQLTGTLVPAPVIIESSAAANANESAAQVIKDLNASKMAADAAAAKADTDEAKAKATGETNKCDDIRKVAEATRTDDQKNKLKQCDADTEAAKKSRDAADAAKAHYEALRKYVANSTPAGVVASGSGELLGAAPKQPSAADRAAVASTVKDIVQSAYAVDEYTMLCLRTLYTAQKDTPAAGSVLDKMVNACLDAMTNGIAQEALVRSERAGLAPLISQRIAETTNMYIPVQTWLSAGDFGNQLAALKAACSKNTGSACDSIFFSSTNLDEARARFGTLGADHQQTLSSEATKLSKN